MALVQMSTLYSHADWSAYGIEAIGLCVQGKIARKGRLRAVSGGSKGVMVRVDGADAEVYRRNCLLVCMRLPSSLPKGPKGQERKTCRWGG